LIEAVDFMPPHFRRPADAWFGVSHIVVDIVICR
jgi:hypothetical protein